MTRTIYLSFLLLLTGTLPLSAAWGQSNAEILDIRLERLARFEALRVLKQYQQNHSLDENYIREDFKSLFSEGTQHTLDLPMFNQNGISAPCSIDDYMQGYQNIYGNSVSNGVSVELLFLESETVGENIVVKAHCLKRFFGETVVLDASFEDEAFTQHLIIEMKTTNGAEKMDQWINPRDEHGRKKRDVRLRLTIENVRWDNTQSPYWVSIVQQKSGDLINKCGGEAISTADSSLALFVNRSGSWVFRDNTGAVQDIRKSALQYQALTPAKTVLNPVTLDSSSTSPISVSFAAGRLPSQSKAVQDSRGNSGTLEDSGAEFLQLGFGYALKQDHECLVEVSVGGRFTQASQQLDMTRIDISSMETDPDGFDYERQSSSLNWTESLEEKRRSFHAGLLGLMNISSSGTPLWLGGSYSFGASIQNQLDYNAASDVFHQGYYEALYGITIDESGIYDFGAHQGSGNGSTSWEGVLTHTLSFVFAKQIGPDDSAEQTKWMSPMMLMLSLGGTYQQVLNGTDSSSLYLGTTELNSGTTQIESFSFFRPEVSLTFRYRIGWKSDVRCDQN